MSRATTDKGRGEYAIRPISRTTKIGILLYPGAKASAVHGLTDLFDAANRFSADSGAENLAEIQTSHWRSHPETGLPMRVFESHPGPECEPDCLVFPPTLDIDAPEDALSGLLAWARDRRTYGALLCSVCGGAFLLARMGLLNGRAATTHWSYSRLLATRFPEVRVNTNELIIDLGDVVTAGGMLAWVDLGLRLVDRYLGPVVMVKTAQFFLADPSGRQQRFYANFSPRLHHGDSAILRVQLWLQTMLAESIDIDAMAATAMLGQRTFFRRFQKATGLTPTEYMQHLKVLPRNYDPKSS
jgi:transcriptional regulator GlxA family with amidase domain